MDEIEFSKIQPEDAVREIERQRDSDMRRYADPSTGLLRADFANSTDECPGCGTSAKISKRLFQRDVFEYWSCGDCSLVYVNPRLNDEHSARLYREGRCMYQCRQLYLPTAEYRARTLYQRKLDQVERLLGRKGALLDFGSSTGYFLRAAVDRGWDGAGVELNPFGVQWAREKLGLDRVHDRPLSECGFRPKQFDAITLWDVLEHLNDPHPTLRDLAELLKPDGVMVVETSHFDCLETEILGPKNTNIVGDMHVTHFTRKSLQRLLERSGLEAFEFRSFGLDLQHIVSYDKLFGAGRYVLPAEAITAIQACVDQAGKGCYIMAAARPKPGSKCLRT